ncbi:MAG: hypothetical protein HN509_02000 [Halobacteriovoraceae bacterium]|jgi:hypothetical protein|nr:hypothetical protein [Halobacteriovoraceae bacterium]MBT5092628.1 hypothetical protein [Halobacteriovoraceae bacterium]
MNDDDQGEQVKEAVVDKIQEIFEKAKVDLAKIECPEHGSALLKFEFDRGAGRFKIETCCDGGEKLVNDAIALL